MEGQAKLGLFFLVRKRNRFFDSSKGRQQTCGFMAKIRALVSNFPNISSHQVATNVHTTIKNLFLFFRVRMRGRMRCGFFDIVVEDVSKSAVSCLNFEPRVSKFPSISSHLVATNVFTTIKNPFLFFRDRMGMRM